MAMTVDITRSIEAMRLKELEPARLAMKSKRTAQLVRDPTSVVVESRSVNQSAFKYYRRLRRVRRYVYQNYSEPISLAQVADIAALEKKYFSTYFHAKTGICFRDWLTDVRIRHAMELMERDNQSITTIAQDVGYQDLRTFERAFKKWTGMSPRSFKKAVRP